MGRRSHTRVSTLQYTNVSNPVHLRIMCSRRKVGSNTYTCFLPTCITHIRTYCTVDNRRWCIYPRQYMRPLVSQGFTWVHTDIWWAVNVYPSCWYWIFRRPRTLMYHFMNQLMNPCPIPQDEMATYSASVYDNATRVWRFERHNIDALLMANKKNGSQSVCFLTPTPVGINSAKQELID